MSDAFARLIASSGLAALARPARHPWRDRFSRGLLPIARRGPALLLRDGERSELSEKELLEQESDDTLNDG